MSGLSHEDVEKYIGEISSGQKLVFIENEDGLEVPIIFKHPTHRDRELSTFIYRRALKEAEQMELPAISEMEQMIKERGLFSKADEEKLEALESRLEGQKAILAKTTRVPANRERLKGIIKDLEDQILEIKLKKERLYDFTRERKALEEKLLYLTWCGSLDPFTQKLYWQTYSEFQSEENFLFRKRTFIEYTIYHFGIDQKTVRDIARSNLWRIRYINALKTGESLFGRPMPEFTVDQLMLVYWSNFYQSIYEMPSDERPPDSIIDDDAALDAYMKDWAAEKNRNEAASRGGKNKYGAPSAWDYGETLVMRSNEMFEDVDYSKTMKEQGKDKGGASIDAAPMGRGKKRR